MKYTYTEKTSGTGWEYVERSDGLIIPKDLDNSDYQQYLAADEAKTK